MMKVSVEVPRQTNNRSATTPGYLPKAYKSTYHRDTCTLMFIPALRIEAKLWNQPGCTTTEEWTKKDVVQIHKGIYFQFLEEQSDPIFRHIDASVETLLLN